MSIALIPATVLVAYSLWESTQPVRLELFLEARMQATVPTLSLAWFVGKAQRIAWVLSATGLFLAPLLRLPRRPILALLRCNRPAGCTAASGLRVGLAWGWIAVALLGVFALVGLRDYKEHAAAWWAAAEGLVEK